MPRPVHSFSQYIDERNPVTKKKTSTRFGRLDDWSLSAFAGIWTTWQGDREPMPNAVSGEHTTYGFLTTEPHAIVRPIHANAMPVIVTTPEEIELWMREPAEEALSCSVHRPELRIVAKGEKTDCR
jgi:putative SOS response-associated peptidase YedK